MKRLLLALFTAALVLAGCSGGKDAVDQSSGTGYVFPGATRLGATIAPDSRKPVGDFTANLLGGGSYQLAADRGKVTVLNFWATWCSPCRIEMPGFDAMFREPQNKGVAFVGIDMKDTASSAKSFVQQNNISYPIVSDEAGRTVLQLGKGIPTSSLPFTIVLDRQQRVAGIYIRQMTSADLQPVLTKLSAEST